jgi:Transcriptional regulatory protein, C terminal/Response regulator receiver domain
MAGMSETRPEARPLVVEDDPNIVELLSASLRLAGFEEATATGGLEALTAVQRHRPDLVVLDVMLPDLDGFDVARRLRSADLELDEESHEVWRAGRRVQLSPTEFKLLRYLMTNAGRMLSKAQILDYVWNYDFRGDSGIVESYVSYLRRKGRRGRAPADPHHPRRRLRPAAARPMTPRPAAAGRQLLARTPLQVKLIVAVLALVAVATGDPVMAIGGFNGSDPAPTLEQFQQYVAEGRIHYFLGGGRMGGAMGGSDAARQITAWVQEHYTPTTVGGATVYDLTTNPGA